jgi:nucleoside phosphorylase
MSIMDAGALRISNCNYTADALLGFVRSLLARDEQLLREVMLRSALMRPSGEDLHHVITRIDVLARSQNAATSMIADYGRFLFVREPLSQQVLLERLAKLSELKFQIADHTVTSTTGIGFSDRLEPSKTGPVPPCTIFDIYFGNTQLSYEPLLHPKLKSFSSACDAIQEYLELPNFNGLSDGRLGRIQLSIPNLNARIDNLRISKGYLYVNVDAIVPYDSLKITVSYSGEGKKRVGEKILSGKEATFELEFSPTELEVWLISTEGFVADFHTENTHHSTGANAVLPKQQEAPFAPFTLPSSIELPLLPATKSRRRALLLTALPLEYKAVINHLQNLREETHPRGTVYEVGEFAGADGSRWDVCVAETGMGNSGAATETERAISYFRPEIAIFVGVAGGLKDVQIGDVVVATKVYGYESGKAQREFLPRPNVYETAYDLQQRARAEAKREQWLNRLGAVKTRKIRAFVRPIASGEKVLASQRSALSKFLRQNCSDAIAIDMEAVGFLSALHASHQVRGLIVRGISDLIDGKSKADARGSQTLAARHASAFSFEVLAKLVGTSPGRSEDSGASEIEAMTGGSISSAAATDSQKVFEPDPRIDALIKDVQLGNKESTTEPAMRIIAATDSAGRNELFSALLRYQYCADQELLWKALPTIEACAEFSPFLVSRSVLWEMAQNPDFSVRSSAASICMDLAQFAPDRVPVDLLTRLSVHSEDWYVESPANAALKAMAWHMPAVLRIFFMRLHSTSPDERVHAAHALGDIAKKEPEILDQDEIRRELARLRTLGDKDSAAVLKTILQRVQRVRKVDGYKYGL